MLRSLVRKLTSRKFLICVGTIAAIFLQGDKLILADKIIGMAIAAAGYAVGEGIADSSRNEHPKDPAKF